jgi:hypothetical protein
MRRAALSRGCVLAVGVATLTGCYAYTPIATLEPAPGTNVSFVLSDEGRMQSYKQIGPYAMRVEGALVQATPDDFTLAVSDVVDIRGAHSRWTGESVSLPRSFVMTTYQKQFSRSKTVLAAVAVAGGIVALIASRNLFGIGGSGNDNTKQPGDPNGQ